MERKRTDTAPHYDLEALKRNVERCNQNIALWQEAIQKEYEAKAKLLALINEIEESRKDGALLR